MNLVQAREQFVKLSGRYDLVVDSTDWADNGADYFLKAGLKFLDREVSFDKDHAKYFEQLAIGEWFASFADYRAIHSVWFATATERWQLSYLSPGDLQAEYGTVPYGNVSTGEPQYWTHAILRSAPEGVAKDVVDSGYGSEIAVDGSQVSKHGVILMPPTDTAGNVEIWAKFRTPWPSEETGTNFWFSEHEHVAVLAGLYQLEISFRNRQGAADWLEAIRLELHGIEKDSVEDDANQAEEMEG